MAQGFHQMTVEQLRELCVRKFPGSTVRGEIMAGFEAIYERAISVCLEGVAWVDGSFLTEKIEPGDIDFIILTDSRFYDEGTSEQKQFIDWMIDNEDEPKKSFYCHTDVVLLYPSSSPWHSLNESNKKHWQENVYGFSVATKEPKGIVVVSIAPSPKVTEVLP